MSKEICLYHFAIPKGLQLDPENILNSQQALEYEKISHEKRKREFLFSRGVLNHVLGSIHGKNLLKIKKSRNGKPLLRGLHFNLSHSGDGVLLAVSEAYALGVDIETAESKKSFKEISQRYFSPSENEYVLSGKNEREQFKNFKVLWSLKESYVKAFDGLLNKKSIRVYFAPSKNKIESLPQKKETTVFFDKKNQLALTVVGKVKVSQVQVFDLNYSPLRSFKKKKSKIKLILLKK